MAGSIISTYYPPPPSSYSAINSTSDAVFDSTEENGQLTDVGPAPAPTNSTTDEFYQNPLTETFGIIVDTIVDFFAGAFDSEPDAVPEDNIKNRVIDELQGIVVLT